MPTHSHTRATSPARRNLGFRVVAAAFTTVMLGGTLPIPLYAVWSPQMHFGVFSTTLVFAVYAVGTMLSLILLSGLSDTAGRRPMLLAAVVVAAISTGLFLAAEDLSVLLAARFLFGLSTGVFTASASAALVELSGGRPRRAGTVATLANLGGLGLGVVIGAAFVQFTATPEKTLYWWYLAALAVTAVTLPFAPETATAPRSTRPRAQRPVLPGDRLARRAFLASGALVFAAFAVNGLFSSLVPAFVHDRVRVDSPLLVGGITSLIFFAALAAQLLPPPRPGGRSWTGTLALGLGTAALTAGLLGGSVIAFIAGTMAAGAGVGLVFRRGLDLSQRLAEPSARAGLLATYFLAAYAGTILPTLGTGLLAQTLGTPVATTALASVVILIAVTAETAGARPSRPSLQEN